jgi:hypothetical protein
MSKSRFENSPGMDACIGAPSSFLWGTTLARLGAGAYDTAIVATPLVSGESRVPVLWGLSYSANATDGRR